MEGLCNAGTFIPAHENMYNKHSSANGTFELRTYPIKMEKLPNCNFIVEVLNKLCQTEKKNNKLI
ncbi:MAG: hypothetical protein KTV72_04950, partial [Wolbachia endosymbiont of Melophagus ovinus]|nr:hypothetical protein [Wolbachia endosymbiont of Melophagus ovinus]